MSLASLAHITAILMYSCGVFMPNSVEKSKRSIFFANIAWIFNDTIVEDWELNIFAHNFILIGLNPAIFTSVCPNAARLSIFFEVDVPKKATPESSILEFQRAKGRFGSNFVFFAG